jgi:hypothetical protein
MQAIIATSSACMDSTSSQKVFMKHMHLHKASMKKNALQEAAGRTLNIFMFR